MSHCSPLSSHGHVPTQPGTVSGGGMQSRASKLTVVIAFLMLGTLLTVPTRTNPQFAASLRQYMPMRMAEYKVALEDGSHSLEELGQISTKELARMVLANCRLTQYVSDQQLRGHVGMFERKGLGTGRGDFIETDAGSERVCLNTKTGSKFFKRILKQLKSNVADNSHVHAAFAVMREPMHRLLSAYLDKQQGIQGQKVKAWVNFARNIARYIRVIGKTQSNLYAAADESIYGANVSFSDFVDYVGYQFLRNNGLVQPIYPVKVEVADYTWWHWRLITTHCNLCNAGYDHILLFEHLDKHLPQLGESHPDIFKEEIEQVKPSGTDSRIKYYFDQLSDDQLRFLGTVMYRLDYAITPYDFSKFCQSINRYI